SGSGTASMRRIVAIRSLGMRFLAMRAKRAASVSWRANFAESLMPIVSERSQSGRREALAAAGAAFSRGRAVALAPLDYKQNYEQNARCTGGAKVGRPRRRPGRPVLDWLVRCLATARRQ